MFEVTADYNNIPKLLKVKREISEKSFNSYLPQPLQPGEIVIFLSIKIICGMEVYVNIKRMKTNRFEVFALSRFEKVN